MKTLRIDLDIGLSQEELKSYSDGHFDTLICDPPYGLGDNPPDIDELLQKWAKGEDYNMGGGFMDKEWDQVPSPDVWKERPTIELPWDEDQKETEGILSILEEDNE